MSKIQKAAWKPFLINAIQITVGISMEKYGTALMQDLRKKRWSLHMMKAICWSLGSLGMG